jgi:NAD-dependent SIR2 family protein deacetylase
MITSSLAERLRKAQHVVVFTGAATSAESGIPTLRDALTGLPVLCQQGHHRSDSSAFLEYHRRRTAG